MDNVLRMGNLEVQPKLCKSHVEMCVFHLLKDGYDITAVQELPGHKDVKTTTLHRTRCT